MDEDFDTVETINLKTLDRSCILELGSLELMRHS